MPKKKEPSTEDEVSVDVLGLPHKKHKKHKHKKHKKRRGPDEGDEGSDGNIPGTPNEGFKPGLKLKIKIGGQTFGRRFGEEARVAKPDVNEASSDDSANIDVVSASPSAASFGDVSSGNPSKKVKKMDEEEAWLAALEAGRLEEVDEELRRMKDPNLMTARQRSLLESKAQKEKEETTLVVAETVVLSEEMIQKKIIKAKKRKEQAEEKLQKDKKQTLERLLKKSDTKPKTKKVVKKADVPRMKYIDSEIKGTSLSIPVGFNSPLKAQVVKEPPAPVLCGMEGCDNRKKYSCSKTGVPLCSLGCYKKNILIADLTPAPIRVS